jgi:hypoxanthine phosphoribosyltransferase
MSVDSRQLEKIFADAECLFDLAEVETALARMAQKIASDLANTRPIVIGVMNGALATLGYILPRLPFLLEVDYVHASRYQGQEQGSELVWKRYPELSLVGRHVLLVDDILDRGITLAAIAQYCLNAGAVKVHTAVLGIKILPSFTPPITADYHALLFPDRYVFGYGMDYQTYWRNAPGIYASR